MIVEHADIKGSAGTYVLGSLDPEDRRVFEAHLAECDECADEVRSLRRVADALVVAVPPRTPRPELRSRVLASLAEGVAPRPDARRSRPSRPSHARYWLPAAALFVLALGIGAYAVRLQTQAADLATRLDRAQASMGVLAAPDLARIDLAGQAAAPAAMGRALWSRALGLVFTASNLPPAPDGRVYQLWVVTGGTPISVGLLAPDASGGGTAFFSAPPEMPDPLAMAVTLEPAGGGPAPTGDRYLESTPGAAF